MNNNDLGKKSACIKMCKELHKAGLLDNNLQLKKPEVNKVFAQICHEKLEESEAWPGTRKRRQVYHRKINSFFSTEPGNVGKKYAVYSVNVDAHKNLPIGNKVGILCGDGLEICPFKIFPVMIGEVLVTVEKVLSFRHLNLKLIMQIKHFHKLVYEQLLDFSSDLIYNPATAKHDVFIVPLSMNNRIDEDILSFIYYTHALNEFQQNKEEIFVFKTENYQDCIIIPRYRKTMLYYVTKILGNVCPKDRFLEKKVNSISYIDYYAKKYNIKIKDLSQSLLECKHVSSSINFMTSFFTTRKSANCYPRFVPELCHIFPLSASFWWQITCMPTILHRINGLVLSHQLFKDISAFHKIIDFSRLTNVTMQSDWAVLEIKKILSSGIDNVCIFLAYRQNFVIYPAIILQALTPASCADVFNLERFELLGDAFLKFAIGLHVFLKFPNENEGYLSLNRSELVSNKTLYHICKLKNIVNYYQGSMFDRDTCIPYGFYLPQHREQQLLKLGVHPTLWSKFKFNIISDEFEKSSECYNPMTNQLVADKCAADCIEALIGVFLLCGGFQNAIKFLHWCGYDFLEPVPDMPKTGVLQESSHIHGVDDLYEKFCLKYLEDKIDYRFQDKSFLVQAVTHQSYTSNVVTDCYQRLEFLGDAVLDYLITGHIYASYLDYKPGQMTDLRSHFVNNETLAKVCVKHKLHCFLQHMSPFLARTIAQSEEIIMQEQELNTEDDCNEIDDVEIPKALGDLVESIIGAVYLDSCASLEASWNVIKLLLKDVFQETSKRIPINCIRELHELDSSLKCVMHSNGEDGRAKCVIKTKFLIEDVTGYGKNARTAKQAAAKLALHKVKQKTATEATIQQE